MPARLTGVQGVPTLAALCVDRVAASIASGRLGGSAGGAAALAAVPRELVQSIFAALAGSAATAVILSTACDVIFMRPGLAAPFAGRGLRDRGREIGGVG